MEHKYKNVSIDKSLIEGTFNAPSFIVKTVIT